MNFANKALFIRLMPSFGFYLAVFLFVSVHAVTNRQRAKVMTSRNNNYINNNRLLNTRSRNINSSTNRGLIMATPAMPECEPYYIAGVYTAVCMRRHLTHVPRNLMTSIQVMDASNNELVALRDGEFRQYPWLKEIYLQDNRIRHIGRNAFVNVTRLHTLVLTGNDLSQLDGDLFRPIAGLRVLRLSNNPLRVLRRETFRHLRRLVELRIDSCLLTKIEPGTLRPFIGSLEVLNVAYNQLTIFTADIGSTRAAQVSKADLSALALKEVHLYGNPWHCNCQMRLLRFLISESPDLVYSFGSDFKAPTCSSPPRLAGQLWSRVPPDRFGCEPVLTGANMPPVPQIGRNVTLQCSFAADPSPTFRWLKDGIPLSDVGSRDHVFTGKLRQKDRKLAAHNFTSRLDLIEITEKFSGIYECVAENSAGSSRSKFLIRVHTADGRYETVNDAEVSAGLLTSLVANEASRSPSARLFIVSGVIGTVLIIFFLTATAIYLCFCRRTRTEKDSSAVQILRKIEAKRLALNANHEASMSLRKNILSNSSSINSQLRHSQSQVMDGEEVKLTEVYPSHLVTTSPSSDEGATTGSSGGGSGADNGGKREGSNSTVVTNDRLTESSNKSSPDNSSHQEHMPRRAHLHDLDEALAVATPLCYDSEKMMVISGAAGREDSLTEADLAMANSAAFKTYSEYLSLTLPKMVQSPRISGRPNNGERGSGLLQSTLCRQLPILTAYGYVEQVEPPPPPRFCANNLSDLDLSDIESASQTGDHGKVLRQSGRRQQRFAGDLHHSVFLPASNPSKAHQAVTGYSTSSDNSVSSNSNNNTNQSKLQSSNSHNGNLVHFLDEQAIKLANSLTTAADTSV